MAPRTSTLALASLLLAAVLVPTTVRATVSCSTVYNALMPCLGYVQSGGPVMSSCCDGIQRVASAASTTSDRRTICGCLKNVASGAAGSYMSRAAGLPGKCGISLPYNISPNVDCRSIN